MIFLVDFENTHASGFDGHHYLTEQDTLVVYYSDENSALQRGVVEDLKEKAVHVRMVKLLKQHSNALDMYIASTTGMFLDTGEKICIVSKDKGYAAVRDFWHSLRGAEILLGETIEECFLHSVANDDERIRRAKERNQKVQLIDAFETTNNVPTRPTLSYRNNYRRRKNNFLDVNSHLDPVELLPNPLAKEDVSYASLVEEEKDGEHFTVDYSATIKEEKLFPDAEHADALEQKASSPIEAEENVLYTEENNASQKEESRKESGRPEKEQGEHAESEHHKEAVNRIYPKTERKVNTGRPSNQIQYIYDPVLKRMKRVDVEDLAEDNVSEAKIEESKIDEPKTKASTAVEEKKQTETENIENSQDNAGHATAENHPAEQSKERSRHHNRRRRRSNAKRDNGVQEPVQNHSQEPAKDNTKDIIKDNAKENTKDSAKENTKDSSKEASKPVKDAKPSQTKSVENSTSKPVKEEKKQGKTSEKQGTISEKQEGNKAEAQSAKVEKEERATKEKSETKSASSKSVSKSSPKPVKAKTEEEKTAKLTEKASKTKVETKGRKEKVEEKTAKAKVEDKTGKAKVEDKTSKAKVEDKTSKAKVVEKSSKAKAEENKSKTKAEKEPKAKTSTKASEEKPTAKTGKAKAEDKKEETTGTQKPSRRGRKKKEETNSSENQLG